MKHITKVKILVVSLLSALAGFCCTGVVFAEENKAETGFWVSPMNQKIILTPGETYEGVIKISNPKDAISDVSFSLSTSPYSVVGEDYKTDLESETQRTQMKNWITFSEKSGTVSPNENKQVVFYINVPSDAAAGGQYASIMVQNSPNDSSSNGGVGISSVMQISSIIYATVTGETKEAGEIVDNILPAFVFAAPVTGNFVIKNTGNIHSSSKTTMQVFPLFSNEEIYTNEEEPQENLIMPDTIRSNTISWNDAPAVGIFRIIQKVEFAGETSTSEKIVIIAPIWLIAIILFIIIAFILWLVMRIKSKRK